MLWRKTIRLANLCRELASKLSRSEIKRAKKQQFDLNFSYYRKSFTSVSARRRQYAITMFPIGCRKLPICQSRTCAADSKTRRRYFGANHKSHRIHLHDFQDLFQVSLKIILYLIYNIRISTVVEFI